MNEPKRARTRGRPSEREAKQPPPPRSVDLFVVRHAPAFEADPAEWPDDCQRPLTDKGERTFRRAAKGLSRVTDPVSLVLASPCVRAWRTAELLNKDAKWPEPEPLEALRPESDAVKALAALGERNPKGPLAVVGHDPLLGALCGLLTGSGRVELKKGAVARLSVHAWRPGGGTLLWLLPPKVLRSLRK
jgi:phosphohistidine phosphatase